MSVFLAQLSNDSPWVSRVEQALGKGEVSFCENIDDLFEIIKRQKSALMMIEHPGAGNDVSELVKQLHEDKDPHLFPVVFLANGDLTEEDYSSCWSSGAFGALAETESENAVISRLRDLLVIRRNGAIQETLLAFSDELRNLTDIEQILQRVAEIIHHDLGWGRVLLSIRDINRGLTGPKVMVGFTDDHVEKVVSRPQRPIMPKSQLSWYRDEYRVSNSFFIPAEADHPWSKKRVFFGWDMGIEEESWRAEDFLLVPIESGEMFLGYFSVDQPRSGKRPNLRQIRELELIAYQAAAAISSYFLTEEIRNRSQLLEKEIWRRKEELDRVNQERQNLELKLMDESRLATIGLMTAGIAHNLNGPLTAIIGYSDIALRKNPDDEHITQILNSALRMQELIQNLTRKTMREHIRQKTNVAINAVVRDELESLKVYKGFKRVTLQEDLDPHLGEVFCRYGDVSQIFGNLLRNAVDALWSCKDPAIWVSTKQVDREVEITIRDNGPGIAEEHRDILYEPFFTTKRKPDDPGQEPSGTGIGLYTVKKAVEQSGFRLTLKTETGEGTLFSLYIPDN